MCKLIDYRSIDKPVRKFVQLLHDKNICTHSSEGGGKGHGAPDFAYVETYLTKENLRRLKQAGFILDEIRGGEGQPLFFGSALKHGEKTGFYLIGLKRIGLSDEQVEKQLCSLLPLLKRQRLHKKFRPYW